MLLLRLIHVAVGVFWVGAALFVALFIFPATRAIGPNGAPFMQFIMERRKFSVVMMTSGLLVIISGIWMYARNAAAAPGIWAHSHMGMAFGIGGLAAILGFVAGAAINAPAGKQLTAISEDVRAKGGTPTAEQGAKMAQLQGRLYLGLVVTDVLLVLATLCMAVARYI